MELNIYTLLIELKVTLYKEYSTSNTVFR